MITALALILGSLVPADVRTDVQGHFSRSFPFASIERGWVSEVRFPFSLGGAWFKSMIAHFYPHKIFLFLGNGRNCERENKEVGKELRWLEVSEPAR